VGWKRLSVIAMVEEDKEIRYICGLLKARCWSKEMIQRLLEMWNSE